jgi:hypothetical protein
VVEPGEWGQLVNGGAWLTVEGQRVDLLYRDLDFVQHWIEEAQAGRYEVDQVQGNLAGMASYVLAGGARAGGNAGGRAAATGVSRRASTGRAQAVSWGVMGEPPWQESACTAVFASALEAVGLRDPASRREP